MTETRSWDRRGRPLSDTDTGPGGVVYSYSVPSTGGYAANGDLLSYTDSVMGQWSFSYDKLDRLMTGTPSSGPYQGQYGCWNYDSFGNRTINVVSAAACTTTATATYNANNQITWLQNLGAPGYPPAGNVSSDSLNQYLYDNENRVCAVRNLLTYVMTGYLYDGGGARVAKGAVANLNACPAVQGFTSITAQYLLGLGGEQVTELDGSGNWQHTNLFAAGRLLATYDTRGQHFHFTDWLGTRRAQTTAAGVSEEQCQSLPFGDGLSCSGSGVDATEHHFTGKERDAESGNDYFGARYYSSTVGRFMTPDWSLKAEPVPFARLDIPQTLNLYAYVGNNPLTHTDVDGHTGTPPDTSDPACNPTAGGKCPNQVAADRIEANTEDDARQALQQIGRDPTLPTAVEEPPPSLIEKVLKPSPEMAFMVLTDGIGELVEAGAALFKTAESGAALFEAAESGEALSKAAKIEKLTAEAKELYPKLAEKADQLHHVIPKYLGGARDGALAKIPAAYHQLITNEFRALAPYGKAIQRTEEEVMQIVQQVYSKFPLPHF